MDAPTITPAPMVRQKAPVYELPVDKGWAWVVLAGAALKELVLVGLTQMTFGVVYLEFLNYYSATPAATAFIGSVTLAVSFLIGPFTAYLSVKWSTRLLVFGSAILSTIALVATMFLPSIYYLYITWGLLLGVADGMTFAPTLGLLHRYFDHHLALAIGLAFTGNGVGQMGGSFLFTYLVDEYGMKGTMLIWAGILLNLFVCALLMRPTDFYTKKEDNEEGEQLPKPKAIIGDLKHKIHIRKRPPKAKGGERPVFYIDTEGETVSPEPAPSFIRVKDLPGSKSLGFKRVSTLVFVPPHIHMDHMASCCDISLFRNARFIFFNMAVFVIFIAYFPIRALLIPGHGHQVGLSRKQVALLPITIGGALIVGRPLLGYLADMMYIPISTFLSLCCVLCGAFTLIIPHVGHGMAPLAVMAALEGFLIGTMLTLPPVLLRDLVTDEQYTVASGWMGISMGIPCIFNYSLFAYIVEATGSWDVSFYICGCCLLIGGVVTFLNHRRLPEGQVSPETIDTKL